MVALVQFLAGLQTPFSDSHAEGGLEHESLEEQDEQNKQKNMLERLSSVRHESVLPWFLQPRAPV